MYDDVFEVGSPLHEVEGVTNRFRFEQCLDEGEPLIDGLRVVERVRAEGRERAGGESGLDQLSCLSSNSQQHAPVLSLIVEFPRSNLDVTLASRAVSEEHHDREGPGRTLSLEASLGGIAGGGEQVDRL